MEIKVYKTYRVSGLMVGAILVAAVPILLFYCFVRLFLVVEAFISMRLLPPSAYHTPGWGWTQYLAHL